MPLCGRRESPSLAGAVRKLKQLADRMKSGQFRFSRNDVENIDKIIDVLYQMEAENKKVKADWETETIRSSLEVDRINRLSSKGATKEEEEMDLSKAAREGNSRTAKLLREELVQRTGNLDHLIRGALAAEKENAELQPERDLLVKQYTETVALMNERMGERVEYQVMLNTTIYEQQEVMQIIMNLEEDILCLPDQLHEERRVMREEKARLLRIVQKLSEELSQQNQRNREKEKEIDALQAKLDLSDRDINDTKEEIERLDKSRADLEDEEKLLEEKLAKLLEQTEDTRNMIAQCKIARVQEIEQFEKEQESLLTEKQPALERDLQRALGQNAERNRSKERWLAVLAGREQQLAAIHEAVARADAELQIMKAKLDELAMEYGALEKENFELQREIARIAEECRVYSAGYERDIDEYRTHIGVERNLCRQLMLDHANLFEVLEQLRKQVEESDATIKKLTEWGLARERQLHLQIMVLELQWVSAENMRYDIYQKVASARVDFNTKIQQLRSELKAMQQGIEPLKKRIHEKRIDVAEAKIIKEARKKLLELERHMNHKEYDKHILRNERQFCAGVDKRAWRGLQIEALEELRALRGLHVEVVEESMSLSGHLEDMVELEDMADEDFEQFLKSLRISESQYMKVILASLTPDEKNRLKEMEAELAKKQKELAEKTSLFLAREREAEEECAKTERRRVTLVELEEKAEALRRKIKEKEVEKAAIWAGLPGLREKLRIKRLAVLEQMKRHARDRKPLEVMIFKVGCKVRAVMEENEKLGNGCRTTSESIASTERDIEDNKRRIESCGSWLKRHKYELAQLRRKYTNLLVHNTIKFEMIIPESRKLHENLERQFRCVDRFTAGLMEAMQVHVQNLDIITFRDPDSLDKEISSRKNTRFSERSRAKSSVRFDSRPRPCESFVKQQQKILTLATDDRESCLSSREKRRMTHASLF